MKKIVISVLLVVLLTGQIFASGDAEASSASSAKEFRIVWWGSQTRHDLTLEVIKLFVEKNPGISVQPEFSGWGGYWERLATQAAGGQMPDIVQTAIASGWGNQYGEQGLFADLYPIIDKGWLDMSNVSDSVLKQNVINGGLYGIPLGVNGPVIMLDAGLVENAGMTIPNDDWTFEEYGAFCNEFAEKSGLIGCDSFQAMNDWFPIYLRAKGFHFIDAANDKLGYEDDQLLIDFWNLLLEMQDKGGVAAPDVNKENSELEARLINSGRAATTMVFSNQTGVISSGAKGPIELLLMPGDAQDKGMFIKSSMDFSITANGNEELSSSFVDFFTNDRDCNAILSADRGIPISSDIRNMMQENTTPIMSKTLEYLDKANALNPQPLDTPHPAFAELVSLITNYEDRVRYFQVTPEEAAAEFRTEAESVFKRLAQN